MQPRCATTSLHTKTSGRESSVFWAEATTSSLRRIFTERCCTPQAKVSRSRAPRATASRYGQKRDSTGRSSWNGASASVCGGRKTSTAIPGTVGAAPVQNIGAYGAEAKDIVESVETLDLATLKEVSIAGCHCGFGYRDSIFKGVLKGRAVITAVTFRLSRTPRPNLGYDALAREVEDAGGATLENIRTAVRRIRGEKLPDPAVTGNAGSFFKNPVVDGELAERIKRKYPDMPSYPVPEGVKIPAGWLIEKTGWKGASLGRAGVYGKQALILVNLGGATGNEVTALARRITDDVETRFGIRIATEVNIW